MYGRAKVKSVLFGLGSSGVGNTSFPTSDRCILPKVCPYRHDRHLLPHIHIHPLFLMPYSLPSRLRRCPDNLRGRLVVVADNLADSSEGPVCSTEMMTYFLTDLRDGDHCSSAHRTHLVELGSQQ